mgnify:CR=1 FL=1
MDKITDDQIELMNIYVGKQEEFTIEILRRYLELKAKYDILDRDYKKNVEIINQLFASSAETIEEEKRKNETLRSDFEVAQKNYLLTQAELHKENM